MRVILVIVVVQCIVADLTVTDAVVLNKFGTKNTYAASRTSSPPILGGPSTCEPVQVLALFRHGIRYPGADDVDAGINIVEHFRIRGVSPSVADKLEYVLTTSLPRSKAKQLSVTGGKEQRHIGFQFGNKFSPLLLSALFDDVAFRASSSQRAIDSCSNFQHGFITDHGLNFSKSTETRDDLLRFFDLCPKYVKEVDKNRSAFEEQHRFQKMSSGALNGNIAKRLNITELHLSPEQLESLYIIAACEVAVEGTHHWNDLLDASDLDLMEYTSDLETFYEIGYGYPINYEMSCPLLADIFTNMDHAIRKEEKAKKGVFYFGHAETLIPLTSLLGLFKDPSSLRADNYREQAARSFKTSRIAPFSSNVAFVLYNCSSSGSDGMVDSVKREYKVQVLFKEEPIALPHHVCPGSESNDGLCPFETLRRYYSQYIDGCNFNERCSLKNSQTISRASLQLLFLMVFAFIFCKSI